MTPREVLALCREKGVRAVDLWLTTFAGRWRSIRLPVQRLDEQLFEQGFAAEDSMLGMVEPGGGSVLLMPQPETAFVDPSASTAALGLICNVAEPVTSEDYAADPRGVLQRAANYLEGSGVADAAQVAVTLEFYLVGDVPNRLRSAVAAGEQQAAAEGVPAAIEPDGARRPGEDTARRVSADAAKIRARLMDHLFDCGFPVSSQQEIDGGAGHSRVELAAQPLRRAADAIQLCKHLTRQLARAEGWAATMMPRPFSALAPSGMPLRVALLRDHRPVFSGSDYAGLSDAGLHALGGLLRHTPALMALINPSTNSYKRLALPLEDGYSQRAGGICRVPVPQASPGGQSIDFLLPDAASNPYLAIAAVVLAVLEGVQDKIGPGQPWETGPPRPATGQRGSRLPLDLDSALDALDQDSGFLLRGEVFDESLVGRWITWKRQTEARALLGRPHPYEYTLYFDC